MFVFLENNEQADELARDGTERSIGRGKGLKLRESFVRLSGGRK